MSDVSREFPFLPADFRRVQDLIKARAGIDLGSNKESLVYGRLARRLRALNLRDFGAYLTLIEDPGSEEAGRFVNAITTNVTEFFRESHHFDFLARTVLPALWRRTGPGAERVRIWSAGCSTGEEPYSLAMTVRENMPPRAGAFDIKILATDLDTDVLEHASAGVYASDRVEKIGPARLAKFFERVGEDGYQVRAELRSLVTFKPLNFMNPWPMQGPFDVIFCRNVVIYFDDATKKNLVQRFGDLLGEGGYLMLGHSESLVGAAPFLASCGRTAYRKIAVARS